MSNFEYEYNRIEKIDKEILWNKILEASGNDFIMTSSLPTNFHATKKLGLVDGHEYTLEIGKEVTYEDKKIRLLKLRNPWGDTKYKGEWGEDSPLWTPELKKKFSYDETYDEEGEFFISYDDFLSYFADVDVCRIVDKICMKKSSIDFNSIPKVYLYEITITDDSYFCPKIFKPYYRFHKELPTDWTLSQVMIMGKLRVNEEANENQPTLKFSECTFTDFYGASEGQVDCGMDLKLSKGKYYIYMYVNFFSSKDNDNNHFSHDLIKKLEHHVNFVCTDFFEVKQIEDDVNFSKNRNNGQYLGILKKMLIDYSRVQKISKENNLLIYCSSNFFDSEIFFLYVKNVSDKDIDFSIEFTNNGLINCLDETILTKLESSYLKLFIEKKSFSHGVVNQKINYEIELLKEEELIFIFSANDIYEDHGFSYTYKVANLRKKTTEEKKQKEIYKKLFSLMDDNNYPIISKINKENLKDLSTYDWVYKKGDVDYKNYIKKLNIQDGAFSYLKSIYPKEIEKILQIVKVKTNHSTENFLKKLKHSQKDDSNIEDDTDLEVQDKVMLGAKDWYLGEWKACDDEKYELKMHGRGMFYMDETYFIGQFCNSEMTGYGMIIYPDNSKLEGAFVSFNPVGDCIFTYNDGKVESQEYSLPDFLNN